MDLCVHGIFSGGLCDCWKKSTGLGYMTRAVSSTMVKGLDRVLAFARHLLYLFMFGRNMQGALPQGRVNEKKIHTNSWTGHIFVSVGRAVVWLGFVRNAEAYT
jgi:hypothetical protein